MNLKEKLGSFQRDIFTRDAVLAVGITLYFYGFITLQNWVFKYVVTDQYRNILKIV